MGIGDVGAIFRTINDPPALHGLKVNDIRTERRKDLRMKN